MLVLLCVQVVQTNNNGSSWREKKRQQLSSANKQMICKIAMKVENLNYKNIVHKIHKLIVKKLKLNVDCHIKTGKNYNLLQV